MIHESEPRALPSGLSVIFSSESLCRLWTLMMYGTQVMWMCLSLFLILDCRETKLVDTHTVTRSFLDLSEFVFPMMDRRIKTSQTRAEGHLHRCIDDVLLGLDWAECSRWMDEWRRRQNPFLPARRFFTHLHVDYCTGCYFGDKKL
jgi:hypothetical protein